MDRDDILTALYNFYYTSAMSAGRGDLDASGYAYDMAIEDMRSMDRAELKAYMRKCDIR